MRGTTWTFAAMGLGSLVLACAAMVPALAQEGDETIIVTGTRIDSDDIRVIPAITRRIPADFVLTDLICQSASREVAERRSDVRATYQAVLALAARTSGVSLMGGQLGESMIPMDTVQFDEIYRMNTGGQGMFSLVLRMATRQGDTFPRITERITAFEDAIPLTGRAECFVGDEQMIGAAGAQRHREALLDDIAREVRALQSRFSPAVVELRLQGGRVQTQPTDSLALEIFIPYDIMIKAEPQR